MTVLGEELRRRYKLAAELSEKHDPLADKAEESANELLKAIQYLKLTEDGDIKDSMPPEEEANVPKEVTENYRNALHELIHVHASNLYILGQDIFQIIQREQVALRSYNEELKETDIDDTEKWDSLACKLDEGLERQEKHWNLYERILSAARRVGYGPAQDIPDTNE